jgi:hypothetical protein
VLLLAAAVTLAGPWRCGGLPDLDAAVATLAIIGAGVGRPVTLPSRALVLIAAVITHPAWPSGDPRAASAAAAHLGGGADSQQPGRRGGRCVRDNPGTRSAAAREARPRPLSRRLATAVGPAGWRLAAARSC